MRKLSNWCHDEMSMSEYCAEKLQSLTEGELQKMTEVAEESIVQILGGPSSSDGAADLLGAGQDVV